jgi:hypothetical protein
MNTENISRIEILENGELILILESSGNAGYQHIYREAAEVYWDKELKGFKSPRPREISYLEQYFHIVKVAKNCSILLSLNPSTEFKNISSSIKDEILASNNT